MKRRTVVAGELLAGVDVAQRDEDDAEVAAELHHVLRQQRRLARVVQQPAPQRTVLLET